MRHPTITRAQWDRRFDEILNGLWRKGVHPATRRQLRANIMMRGAYGPRPKGTGGFGFGWGLRLMAYLGCQVVGVTKMGKTLGRWGPLVSGLFLVVMVVLRAFGLDGIASLIETIGGATGLLAQSPITLSEAAAVGLAIGVGRKLWSSWRKAQSQPKGTK